MLLFLLNNEQLIYIGSIELLLNIPDKGGRKSFKTEPVPLLEEISMRQMYSSTFEYLINQPAKIGNSILTKDKLSEGNSELLNTCCQTAISYADGR